MPSDIDLSFTVTLPEGNPYQGTYVLNLAECTGLDDLDCRKATGYSIVGLMQEVEEDNGLGLVLVGVVVWLVRRREYPHVTFDMVARTINWGTDFQLLPNAPVDENEDDEGKAPATAADS